MYIAAENVYYETIIRDEGSGERNISSYALGKRVIPVSPNSLYAYLQAIVLGLKGMKIEDRTKEIIQYLGRLQTELLRFREDFGLLGRHIGHAHSCYQNSEKRLEQFAEKLLAAESGPAQVLAPASGETKIA
jgi:DNA recombination protein RmuC